MPTFISFLILMIPCFLASELDLLSSINYSSLKKGNDTTKNKLISNLPVYRFHRSFKNFMLMRNASSNFLNTVDNILGLVFIFKPSRNQHQIANLFSINTPGRTSPELQIIVNFKKRHFIIHYISSTSGSLKKQIVKMIGRSFHGWTALDMTLHPTFVDIQVNCKSFRVKIDDGIQFMFDKDSLIYFRQEPGYKLQFVGKFQVAKLRNHASKNLPWKCYSRRTFGKRSTNEDVIPFLLKEISTLKEQMKFISNEVDVMNKFTMALKSSCDCASNLCFYNEQYYISGEKWNENLCTICTCEKGMVRCEIDATKRYCVEPCSSSPCHNGGTCLDFPGHSNFKCKCPIYTSGKQCKIILEENCCLTRSRSDCIEHMSYVYNDTIQACVSSPRNYCDPNPCKNGGSCIPSVWSDKPQLITCTCQVGFDGPNCESKDPQRCFLLRDSGSCNENITSWFYNYTHSECQPFVYGGCFGNGNRFKNKYDCFINCEIGACCYREPLHPEKIHGFNREGRDRYGNNFEMNDTMKYIQRFDLNKLDFQGFNEIGFDKDGFDHQSYDKQGYHRETGFNLLGFNRLGDHDGIISFKFDGYNREGYNRAGFNCHGINKYGYDYHGFASGWIFYCRAMSESRCRNMEYEYPYLKREVVAFSRGKRCHEISCELKCGCSYLNSNFSLGLSFELLQRNCSCGKDGLIQCTCDHISSRKEINDLTSEKLKTYINAVKRSVIEKHTSLSKWQNLAMMYADFAPHHQGSLVSLPWIRMFLLTVESELGVSIPYFDWTVVAGVPLSSIVWSSNYFGTNGTAKNHCIEDNPFVDEFKSIWYPCLKRNLNLKVSLPNAIQVESIMRMADYRDFEMNMELFSSIFGQFLGGHGLTPYAVYDPLFISHLAFIDKLWFEWETRHRTFPASKRYVVLRPFGKVCDEVLLESYKMCVSYMPISNRLPCLKPLNISKSDIEVKKVDCDTDYLLFAKIWLQEYLKTILSANLSIMRYCPDIQTVPERYNLKIWHSRSDRISTWKALSQNLTSQVIDIAYANEKEITYVQLCAKFNFEERCGPGEEVMSCSENPCKTAVCVSNPLLNCSHTVCNECKAKFYSNDSNISTNCIEIGCYDGSIIRRNMEVWIPSICNQCTCNDGKISCGLVTCEVPFCSHPRRSLNECCSKCDGCSYKGRNYEDGDIFDVLNDICIKCSCSRGNIYCRRTICPTLESCPSSDVVTLNGACCPLCSSCGTRSHGDTWIKTENCKFCKCQYGEEICSKIECQSINCTSANAEVLHKCCSSCGKDCILNNQRIHNGDTFHLSACEQCKCIQGALKCATKICPDLNECTKEAIIPSTDSKCCPSCATDTIGPCTLYNVGLSFHPIDDSCFICKCDYALKWFCSWLECRPLSCPVKFRKKAQNECCPKCDYCFTEDGRKYKNEENWISKFDPCVSCTCVHGVKQCRSIEFLCKSLDCGLNKKPILKPGHCCPICK